MGSMEINGPSLSIHECNVMNKNFRTGKEISRLFVWSRKADRMSYFQKLDVLKLEEKRVKGEESWGLVMTHDTLNDWTQRFYVSGLISANHVMSCHVKFYCFGYAAVDRKSSITVSGLSNVRKLSLRWVSCLTVRLSVCSHISRWLSQREVLWNYFEFLRKFAGTFRYRWRSKIIRTLRKDLLTFTISSHYLCKWHKHILCDLWFEAKRIDEHREHRAWSIVIIEYRLLSDSHCTLRYFFVDRFCIYY